MQVEPTDNKPVENTGQATNAPSTNVVEPVPEHEMKDVEQPQLPPSTGNETSTAASTTEVKSPEQPAQNTQPAATDKPALQDGKFARSFQVSKVSRELTACAL